MSGKPPRDKLDRDALLRWRDERRRAIKERNENLLIRMQIQALRQQTEVAEKQRRKPGPPPKHDWPLVVKLAVQTVKDRHYNDEPLPEPCELTASVAEQYLEAKGYDLDEKTSDLRKYCSAVLAGFRDADMDSDA